MKYRSLSSLILIGCSVFFGACEKDFLQMPLSNTTTVDSVFSTSIKAQGAIANAYRISLLQGLPAWNNWNALIQANLSGELTYGQAWTPSNDILKNGLTATGTIEDMAGFTDNFPTIRQAYLVKENIDKVKDMSAADKAIVKGEMQALVAYRYEQMFIMYGGVPIISKSFLPTDELAVPRNSLQQVLDSIVSWCDQAIIVLPSAWPENFKGRMTKAAALAIKSKALLYAARPLFNSAKPYLDFGSGNNLICFGTYNANRWKLAADAADAVITEAETNGGHSIINTGNPLDDYGTATSTPGNKEVLLAFKFVNTYGGGGDGWSELPMNAFYNPRYHWQATANVLITNFLENYYTQTGTDQDWADLGEVRPFTDYTTRMNQMEARFKACFMPYEMDAWNNPGDANWSNTNVPNGSGYGIARSIKFYYKAGSRRWFEFPVFRLAAAYLSAAEAYNETGETQKALEKLNKIRLRAGLPLTTVTDQAQLRSIIQREWAVEFFNENYRLHDVKHWKLPNINNGILGGPVRGFAYNNNTGVKSTGNTNYTDRVQYPAFFSDRMYLNPFPQSEINKGILIQNPGY